MALSKTTMANFRLLELEKAYPGILDNAAVKDEMTKYFEADSEGIIKEFKTNAQILPGTFTNGGGSVTGTGKVS